MDQRAYCLKLANGQTWCLVAVEGANFWLEKLAELMQLKICDSESYSKLIFVRKKPNQKDDYGLMPGLGGSMLRHFPQDGWYSHTLSLLYIPHPISGKAGVPELRFWFHDDVSDVICDIGSEEKSGSRLNHFMSLFVYPIYKQAQYLGGLPFHSALIQRDGIGIMLMGDSGAGKSTCCHRIPLPWHALCDDETLVICDNQGRYLAHPFPTWSVLRSQHSSQTWNVQHAVPLVAIFLLQQAEADGVTPMDQAEAATAIIRSVKQIRIRSHLSIYPDLDTERNGKLKMELVDNACRIAKTIPVFTLKVSLAGHFWEEIDAALAEVI